MHDFYLAKDILDEALKQASRSHLKSIQRLVVSLGDFLEHDEEILPKNLKHNFQLLAKETIAAKARLIIKKINQKSIWRLEEIEGE